LAPPASGYGSMMFRQKTNSDKFAAGTPIYKLFVTGQDDHHVELSFNIGKDTKKKSAIPVTARAKIEDIRFSQGGAEYFALREKGFDIPLPNNLQHGIVLEDDDMTDVEPPSS